MQFQLKNATSILMISIVAWTLGGCLGATHTVTVDAETARLEFGVVAVQLEAGDATLVDFCVVLNDSICGFPGGEVLGCGFDVTPANVIVYCADPILAEWPDTWTLQSATWSAPSVPTSGTVLVEPAFQYLMAPGAGIITDPDHSAYVMRLDRNSDFGPADVEFTLEFDHGGETSVVLKAVEVATAELQSAGNAKILVPLGSQIIDFPNLPADHGITITPVATDESTWGKLKSLFR